MNLLQREVSTVTSGLALPLGRPARTGTAASSMMPAMASRGSSNGAVKVGPWGGHGGTPRDMNPRVPADHLESITVRSPLIPGGHICGLSFVYVDRKGQSIPVGPWGASKAGTVNDAIALWEDDYLAEVSGTSDGAGITSLTFVTSSGAEYGPYGFPIGTPFSLSLMHSNSHVIGFFGRSGEVLNALGLYLAPRT